MVTSDYIEKIIDKINTRTFDYYFYSWKYIGVLKHDVVIEDMPPWWNCGVVNCVYSRKAIGNERFNEEMKTAEDFDFNERVRKGKKENITDIIYFYRDNRKGSLTNS